MGARQPCRLRDGFEPGGLELTGFSETRGSLRSVSSGSAGSSGTDPAALRALDAGWCDRVGEPDMEKHTASAATAARMGLLFSVSGDMAPCCSTRAGPVQLLPELIHRTIAAAANWNVRRICAVLRHSAARPARGQVPRQGEFCVPSR